MTGQPVLSYASRFAVTLTLLMVVASASATKVKPLTLSKDQVPPKGYLPTGLQVPVQNQPTILPDLPYRANAATCAITELEGEIHLLAPGTETHYTYTPGSTVWIIGTALTESNYTATGATAAVVGNTLYGALQKSSSESKRAAAFTKASNSWSPLPLIPDATYGIKRLANLNGQLLALTRVGGAYVFNTSGNSWSQLSAIPIPAGQLLQDAVAVGNTVYAAYGLPASVEFNLVHYVADSNSWSSPSLVPMTYSSIALASLSGNLYLFGSPRKLQVDLATGAYAVAPFGEMWSGAVEGTSLGFFFVDGRTAATVNPVTPTLNVFQKK